MGLAWTGSDTCFIEPEPDRDNVDEPIPADAIDWFVLAIYASLVAFFIAVLGFAAGVAYISHAAGAAIQACG